MTIIHYHLQKAIKFMLMLLAAFAVGVVLAFVDTYVVTGSSAGCSSDMPLDQVSKQC